MRTNGRRSALLVLAMAMGACANEPGPTRFRIAKTCGPADEPMLALEVYEDDIVTDCDAGVGSIAELRLVFDARDESYSFDEDSPGGSGKHVDADGAEHDVVSGWLVLESNEDGIANGSYGAVVMGQPEISGTIVDGRSCPLAHGCP